jgi:hypothetical protein
MVWSRSWAASRAAAVGAQPDTDVQDTCRLGRESVFMVGGLVTNTRKRPCLWGGLPRISPECAGDGTLAAKPEPGAIVIAEPRSWREIRRRLGTSCVVLGVPAGLGECGGCRCLRNEPVGRAEKTPGGGVRRPREGAGGDGMTRGRVGPSWCLCVDLSPAATAPDAAVTS